ncbi:MAG TPA: metallophosphoesterase [Rhabdochlamydiaceae bacterium]|jgi:hypothetical protein
MRHLVKRTFYRGLLFILFLSGYVLHASLLTDPFLQNPTPSSINVVWFTEVAGIEHYVEYGDGLVLKALCTTAKLARMRENQPGGGCRKRDIYRHEAVLRDLSPAKRTPYRAVSLFADAEISKSAIFSCASVPQMGTPLKILLTSDHQIKPMVAANLQKVQETCPDIDAIFFAGDTVDHPDCASEWFDDPSGGGFFSCLQGKASRAVHGVTYRGGALMQCAPLFSAIGNHEVMGRWNMQTTLEEQFEDPFPKEAAEKEYAERFFFLQDAKHRQQWVKEHSFNTDSYEEIFSLPQSSSGGKKYYAVTFGDVRLIVLYATRIWRAPNAEFASLKPGMSIKGKYTEEEKSFAFPSEWGYGDFIFESMERGSPQYCWLEEELQSDAFQKAKYKIVMLHNPLHCLGENAIPPFAHPVQEIEKDAEGKITSIRYRYPKDQDILIADIEPLLIRYGVQLVLCGHAHLWNRFQSPQGMHYLETSNVGNSYGAYLKENKRSLLPEHNDGESYAKVGDPYGLSPIVPTIAPLKDAKGMPLPYIASNEITVFSIFNTAIGSVDSYYFNTAQPESEVVHFDRFYLQFAE